MSSPTEFLDRVMQRVPASPPHEFQFQSWPHGGRPTKEAMGLLPVSGVDSEKFIAAVLDIDHYVGNVEHVLEARRIDDPRFEMPKSVRFYEKINVPMVAKLQMDLVLEDQGEVNGFRVVTWRQLDAESDALDPKQGARSDYNVGLWMIKPGLAGYALASAPRRKDVGLIKFKALTKGADALAPAVIKANIECLANWARKR